MSAPTGPCLDHSLPLLIHQRPLKVERLVPRETWQFAPQLDQHAQMQHVVLLCSFSLRVQRKASSKVATTIKGLTCASAEIVHLYSGNTSLQFDAVVLVQVYWDDLDREHHRIFL